VSHRRFPRLPRVGLIAFGMAFVLAACGEDVQVHPLGGEAIVGYNERTDTGERGVSTRLGITVLRVRQGTHEELRQSGFEADPEDQNTTPYYVDARYENQGPNAVTRNLSVSLEDSDGNLIGSTLIFNFGDSPLEACPQVNEGTLAPGESYESCTLFLVPEGVNIGRVSFLSDNGPNQEPEFVYWETE
jgi:hypothetical protein